VTTIRTDGTAHPTEGVVMEPVNVTKVMFGSPTRTGSGAGRTHTRQARGYGDETPSAVNAARPLRLRAVDDENADGAVADQPCSNRDDDPGGEVLAW
jgi:hypothetical protein